MPKVQKNADANLNETLVSLLLPISRRMLVSGLGIGDLVRAAKQAYVRAAISYLTSQGSRVSASHLSVVTGLTRKEITGLLKEAKGSQTPVSGEPKEQRAKRVLRGWRLDPRFCDNDGAPASLPLRGEKKSFSALVKLYGGDVTPNSVLRELERLRAVSFSKSHGLRLRSTGVGGKSTENLTDLARLFPDFANTVSPERPSVGRPLFFSFKDSAIDSLDQAAKFQQTFSNRALAMLQGFQEWLVSQQQNRPLKPIAGDKQVRVGIGVYLIQRPEDVNNIRAKERSASPPPSSRKRKR
jgi:hypothetical protein